MMPFKRIEIDEKVMFGKPVVKDTRIPMETVLKKVSEGWTHERIMKEHPRLKADDIRECVDFSRFLMGVSHQILDRDKILEHATKRKALEKESREEAETA